MRWPIWDGLRTSPVRAIGLRTELSAGFAADGYARTSGRPAPLLLSTGPGALISLAALMEAASAHVPVVAIASQIPRELIGAGRGFLHELPDQKASFAPVVKWAARAECGRRHPRAARRGLPPRAHAAERPGLPRDSRGRARRGDGRPPWASSTRRPSCRRCPPRATLEEAVRLLAGAERPVVWAGGGVLRSGAWDELRAVAERLDAPVVTTYMGKGAFPEDHPLAAGSASDEPAVQELLSGADAILAVGTELGAETTGHYSLELRGRLVHVDADPRRIGATYEALGLVGDARGVLAALLEGLPAADSTTGEQRVGRGSRADRVAARRAGPRARARPRARPSARRSRATRSAPGT